MVIVEVMYVGAEVDIDVVMCLIIYHVSQMIVSRKEGSTYVQGTMTRAPEQS